MAAAGAYPRFTPGQPRFAVLEIVPDKAALDQVTREIRHIPGALARMWPPALNAAAQETRTVLYKEFLLRMNIARKGSVKKRLELKPKATRHHPVAGVRIALSRFTVASFKGVRQLKEGVRWSAAPGAQRVIPRAFVRKGFTHDKTGGYLNLKQVWRRKSEGGRLVPRYPLSLLRGPSLAAVWENKPALRRQTEKQAGEIAVKKVSQQVARILARATR